MAGLAEFEQRVELVFHNIQYILSINVANGDTLSIEAEQKSDGNRWRGDFTAAYIEDIAQKTGSFKTFGVFVKMLRSAILQESDSVFVDLLTYQDLELLKNRKGRNPGQPPRPPPNNKRYFILTYNSEFDRVHYPLPLVHEDNPDPEALKMTIRRLRDELEESRSDMAAAKRAWSERGGGRRGQANNNNVARDVMGSGSGSEGEDVPELIQLRIENERLKAKLKEMRELQDTLAKENGRPAHSSGTDSEDARELRREVIAMRKERQILIAKLDAKDAELARLHPEAVYGAKLGQAHLERGREIEGLRRQIERLEDEGRAERASHKRALARLSKENAALTEQLAQAREAERRFRVRVREVESELEVFRRRAKAQTGARDAPPLRARPPPASSNFRHSSPAASSRAGSSRGASPTSSRGTSPAHSRRPSQTGASASGRPSSRPNSAPSAFRRFDPTAYVKEKEARDEQARSETKRWGVTGRAKNKPTEPRYMSPTRSSPVPRPRQSSAPNTRNGRAATSATAVRASPGRTGLPERAASRGGGGRPTGREYMSSPERPWRSDVEPRPAPLPSRAQRTSLHRNPIGPHSTLAAATTTAWTSDEEGQAAPRSRASSPARALREVKAKLAEFASSERNAMPSREDERGRDGERSRPRHPPQGNLESLLPTPVLDDASEEIADIDMRLHALQNFLKAAKANTSSKVA